MTSTKRSITILIGIIGVLLVLLAGSIGYILGNSSVLSANTHSNSSNPLVDPKVMKEVEELKKMYDSKIAEKTNNYKALKAEREKVQLLVSELEKTKNDANALLKYKNQYQSLESKMKILVNEIVVLKTKKTNIVSKQTKPAITQVQEQPKIENKPNAIVIQPKKEVVSGPEPVKTKSDDFFGKKELPKTTESTKPSVEVKKQAPVVRYEKFTKVTLSNVKAAAYSIKSGDKIIETNVSNKAELIKISFTLDEVPSAKPGDRTYYIQIINARNNVIGKRITEYFDSESLTYSLSKIVNYNNQALTTTIDFPYKDFEKGVYFINIFDRNDLVGKSSFILK